MLWIKSFHIVFVASWFAGLFYLPRIFVNLAQVSPDSEAEYERLILMARKLMRFMNLLMLPAVGLGLWLWFSYWMEVSVGGWIHAKMFIVLLCLAYHHYCGVMLRRFEACTQTKSHVWFRWFNEIPVVLMLAAVILVVVKPF
jgi:putative membrane protein